MKTKKVRLTRPGALSAGDYKAGAVYDVDAAEAERLIKIKGFELVEPKPQGDQ